MAWMQFWSGPRRQERLETAVEEQGESIEEVRLGLNESQDAVKQIKQDLADEAQSNDEQDTKLAEVEAQLKVMESEISRLEAERVKDRQTLDSLKALKGLQTELRAQLEQLEKRQRVGEDRVVELEELLEDFKADQRKKEERLRRIEALLGLGHEQIP